MRASLPRSLATASTACTRCFSKHRKSRIWGGCGIGASRLTSPGEWTRSAYPRATWPGRERHAPGHFNRLIERKVVELGGIKSLYSDSYFPEDEFNALYGGDAYKALKAKYDPTGAF